MKNTLNKIASSIGVLEHYRTNHLKSSKNADEILWDVWAFVESVDIWVLSSEILSSCIVNPQVPPLLKTVTQSWLSGCWAVSGLWHMFSNWLELWAVQLADTDRDWGTPHLHWNLGKLQCSYNWTTLTTVKCPSLGLCKRRRWKSLLLPSGAADRVLTLPRNGSQMVSQFLS